MSRLLKLTAGALLIAIAAGAYFYFNQHESTADRQSTNDAYMQVDFTNVASRVAGVVETVLVEENQIVRQGDPLVILDDRDLKIAVQNAEAAISVNQANIRTLNAQIERQHDLIVEAEAAIAADDAILGLARANEGRLRSLVGTGVATRRSFDEAVSNLGTATATRDSHVAGLSAARRQLDILSGQLEGARAALDQARASLADVNLRLSYTRIAAPISGTIGQKAVRTGAYVTVGTTLLSIVPLDKLYVRANIRETQLARVRPGQTVEITVDALPGQIFTGTVESLGPASGVSYSAIAPQNATGNFTKVVQRLPVRISIEPDQSGLDLLRVGMSVVPEILIE
ncbi:HlyD family secretion protein [Acuticoccus sediminis]|uniref:HlyD family secretion protein n=1 Tax=Acuticoccus sediminis TaxID=2184697 RepID=UPI001CFF4FCD|nr:HlyD family secretion protein [Acuticoccus sediminis]